MTETVSIKPPELVIDDEFKHVLEPLTPMALSMLKQSIIKAGRATDPLIVWKETGILIDGHHRHALCTELGLPFDVIYESHPDRASALDAARLRALARRNLNENSITYHLGTLYDEGNQGRGGDRKSEEAKSKAQETQKAEPLISTADRIAEQFGKSASTIKRASLYKRAADTLAADGAPLQRVLEQPKAAVIKAAKEPEPRRKEAAQVFAADPKKKLNRAVNETKRAETVRAGVAVEIALASEHSAPNEPPKQEPPRVEIGGHLLLFGDNADPAILAQIPDRVALAFCDPPYNSTEQDWDGAHVWTHDWLIEVADVVAVTPGISAIADFMQRTRMPYQWSTATHIKNGMTRGALGFGNWMYTALFSALPSIHRNAQDHSETTIKASDKFEDHSLGAQRQKPPGYLSWLFALLTKEGDTVLDPFAGSGTSVMVAHRLGRACIAIEKDAATYQAMVRRVRLMVENSDSKEAVQ